MSATIRQLFSRDEFLQLANRAGLQVTEADLEELSRRKLLRGWEPRGSRTPQSHFHRLHLYVLARYFDAVSAVRHPWGLSAAEVDLRTIAEEARQCRDLVDLLMDAHDGEEAPEVIDADSAALLSDWSRALRTRAQKLNPLGPLADLTALFTREALDEMRGDGLLFVAFRELADALEAMLPARASAPQDTTEPASAPPAEASSSPSADSLPDSAEPDAQSAPASADDDLHAEVAPQMQWADDEVTQFDPTSMARAASEKNIADMPADPPPEDGEAPQSGAAPAAQNEFSRDQSQATARTIDLQSRLARLRNADKQTAEERREIAPPAAAADERLTDTAELDQPQTPAPQSTLAEESLPVELKEADMIDDDPAEVAPEEDIEAGNVEEVPAEEVAVEKTAVEETALPGDLAQQPADDLRSRTEQLNQLRQTYLAEQRWEDLAALYENGLELFVDPAELQHVFLTLALIYEVKLKQLDRAFDRFSAAWRVPNGGQQGRQKAFDGLQRLGRQTALQTKWIEFLEAQLLEVHPDESSSQEAQRADLKRHLALALHASGQDQRAFFTYTAFLADARPEQVDARALDDLEKLASGADAEALGDFFADLLGHALPDALFEPMALRAARHHADRGEVGLAMEYYERILERLPAHEVAFLSLGQLYEESARWVRLKALYEARIARQGEDAPASLRAELQRIKAQMKTEAPLD